MVNEQNANGACPSATHVPRMSSKVVSTDVSAASKASSVAMEDKSTKARVLEWDIDTGKKKYTSYDRQKRCRPDHPYDTPKRTCRDDEDGPSAPPPMA